MTTHAVYEGMACPTCARPLVFIERQAVVDVFCESCGVIRSVMYARCRGASCSAPLIFGGKNGKTPINIRTGASHFIDCPDAPKFRKHAAKAERAQGGLL